MTSPSTQLVRERSKILSYIPKSSSIPHLCISWSSVTALTSVISWCLCHLSIPSQELAYCVSFLTLIFLQPIFHTALKVMLVGQWLSVALRIKSKFCAMVFIVHMDLSSDASPKLPWSAPSHHAPTH